ncbi:MAG: SPBc2 prophage-derived DNA polymerase yorL [Parcubacteria group bacterium GW2011_GWB1_49_7]|nr:MAG: SPBc2 prophage-derived DNA polymerase yorL [Parcubacteria group bacterium GW2011_GWB1_49_7]
MKIKEFFYLSPRMRGKQMAIFVLSLFLILPNISLAEPLFNPLNVATFKTLKPKLAILTAGRGLNYNYDEIQAMSDMIPIERGAQWSLNDCLFGADERCLWFKGRRGFD